MAKFKCCVIGCDSTSGTHRLFCMPMNDNLRNLWMSMLVPTSPYLLCLTKSQLLTKRVCIRHFDHTQFDQTGVRIRFSYPCLFTEKEMIHGVPLSSKEYNVLCEHNYCVNQDADDGDENISEPIVLMGMPGDVLVEEHGYSLPTTSVTEEKTSSKLQSDDNVLSQEQDESLLPTFQAVTPGLQNEGVSLSRRPLADISQNENVEAQLFQTSKQATSKGVSLSRRPLADISQNENVEAQLFQTSKQATSKGISKINQFKSKTRHFIKETTKIAVDSLGQTSMERLKNAQKHAGNVELMANFEKLGRKARDFLIMQLRLARKNKMARRFSFQDKLFALALMKQSPKGYKLLENIFALPTKRTLARLSERIVFECGINANILNHIKNTVKNWDEQKKLCSLVFDEVALTPYLIYNENKDQINGFVEIAGERKQKFADHALVFMVRGICSSWRQSIAYYFCAGTVSAAELEKILKEIIPKLSEAGLKPLALVCDQGSTFRSCFKNIKATTARLQTPHERRNNDAVYIAGHELLIFHDPPHLLKGIRNIFLDKDLLYEGKRASWDDILYVYDLDNKSGHTRALPKLTADHVDPKKMKKMKVKVAAQVLSARTAAMLNYTHAVHERLNSPKETMATTAAVVLFFDELFDSVNGSPGQGKGKLRCAVKQNSAHMEFWTTSLKKLKNIKYIDTNSKLARRAGQPRQVRVPSLEGWITTLNSFLELAKLLFSVYKVEYFYPRLINQDPLENFFGRIRAMNYRNINPDVNAFVYTFKSLVISTILTPQSKFSNCEGDNGETLIDLNYLFTSSSSQNNKENVSPDVNMSSSSLTLSQEGTPLEQTIAEKVKVQTSAYTAGYMCRKMTKKFNCNACAKTYTTKEIQGIHEFITHREYKRLKNNNLVYPNGVILRLYRQAAQYIHSYLNTQCHENNIKRNLNIIIGQYSDMSWLGCKKHNEDIKKYFKTLIIRLHVHNWCNIINKILSGKIEEKYVLKMHSIHIAALKKYRTHRLRQKGTKNT